MSKKLKIEDLEVQSFVTSLDAESTDDAQGRSSSTFWFCDTTDGGCNTTDGMRICNSWGLTKCTACDGGSYFWCSEG